MSDVDQNILDPGLEQERAAALRFAYGLGRLLPLFDSVVQDSKEFWVPDEPLPGPLLGSMGTAFAAAFQSLTAGEQAGVLSQVEQVMSAPGDGYLSTMVATEFIEAMVHQAERDGTWPAMREALLPSSREFADAYVNAPFFTGQSS